MSTCPTCGKPDYPGVCPPEPPVGTWVRDRFGGLSMRQPGGGWGEPGMMPFGRWEAMWRSRGPLVRCAPYGQPSCRYDGHTWPRHPIEDGTEECGRCGAARVTTSSGCRRRITINYPEALVTGESHG